jgi:hypothetical protein
MSDGIVIVQPDSTGKKIDTSELTVGPNTVERQRTVIADDSTAAALAKVRNSAPGSSDYGVVTWPQPALLAQAAKVSGTIGSATDVVNTSVIGYNCALVTVNGTYAGVTFVFEISDDGGTSYKYSVFGQRTDTNIVESGSSSALTNANRAWMIAIPGATNFQVRATSYTSGTANIGITPCISDADAVRVIQLNSGTQVKLTDGTNIPNVKPASTAPAATDPALVVAISPNTPPSITATATKTSVAGATTSTTLLAANSNRKGATFFNDSSSAMYLDLSGGTASSSSYSVKLFANQFYALDLPVYTGAITAIWDTATGNVRITEFS